MRQLARFAWIVLAYNGAVILWGAFVRATGSGAGCGSHWPVCNGEVIPRAPSIETMIELTHRVTSGLALIAVVALVVLAFRAVPPGHRLRRAAAWSLVFMLLEAAVGAGLVLFEWVAGDRSLGRGIAMGVHLVNTLLLIAALTLLARFAADEVDAPRVARTRAGLARLIGIATAGMFLTAASGGIAALGDTLFPARSLAAGLAQDLSSTSHAFLRLRTFHPFLAAGTGLLVIMIAIRVLRQQVAGRVRTTAVALIALVAVQITAGALDVLLLAPLPLQIVHLGLADALWVAFVLLVADLDPSRRAVDGAGHPSLAARAEVD